ncbi:MAG TPA: protein-L-isoaspartate(D-aspartate) O-methyltransferase, partial [Candidatus Polarisedimenticolaceae bacterium]|nr:protein-L-isoaspartate(D-aspartate) O-methyltransferase [Candidatus Polarisedimenticolaceae bacterium]
ASAPCSNSPNAEDPWMASRELMVVQQLQARGISDPRVLAAMRKVPRHELIPEGNRADAYGDHPVPIGEGQTISQPLIVAYMTECLELTGSEKVLEVGTGSGYQAAILGELAREVYSIEIVPSLAKRAAEDLKRLGYTNIHVREGDGYRGWPEEAPFDGIIITAAPPQVPQPLLDQLKIGGRLVAPIGVDVQQLVRITRTATGFSEEKLVPVRFVPMTGEAQN